MRVRTVSDVIQDADAGEFRRVLIVTALPIESNCPQPAFRPGSRLTGLKAGVSNRG